MNHERLEKRKRIIVEGEHLATVDVGRREDRGTSGESKGERASAKSDLWRDVPAENEESTANALLRKEM